MQKLTTGCSSLVSLDVSHSVKEGANAEGRSLICEKDLCDCELRSIKSSDKLESSSPRKDKRHNFSFG
jgi:hypothetical protein